MYLRLFFIWFGVFFVNIGKNLNYILNYCICNLICFNVIKLLFRVLYFEFEIDEELYYGYIDVCRND